MTTSFLILSAFCAAACVLAGQKLIHWFQLESYQFPGYFRSLKRGGLRSWVPGLLLCVLSLGLTMVFSLVGQGDFSILSALLYGALFLLGGEGIRRLTAEKAAKKPLVFTYRVKRLHAITFMVIFALYFLTLRLTRLAWWASAFFMLLPLWLACGGLFAWPVEKFINELYFRDAQRILRQRPDLIRIGITGSWGKTSVKFILGALLQEKYNTLITPSSFNTPMGLTSVIRTKLEPGHRVFVAEMGARHVGDIKELCRLVHPQFGVLTSVGPQHLDTFHTLDRIRKTKYELMDAIPSDGSCFFADDDGIVLELYEKTQKEKFLAGLDGQRDDVWAENIHTSPVGSDFILRMGDERVPCHTEMLGELNIRNIVLCASVCRKLGMSALEISRGIAKLQPVEHRLQLIRNPGGMTVIDDAFNSNILGARQAFQVLKRFPGRRVIVTPGMVELGQREEELNRAFGRDMADCCDVAILVGRKHSQAIVEGLVESGFPREQIFVVRSLAEATDTLRSQRIGAGDSVLFENDLPDHYNES